MLKDKKHKIFVCRINGFSIYYSDKNAKQDADRFLILTEGKQICDYSSFIEAIIHLVGTDDITEHKKHVQRLIELSKEFDGTSTSRIESWLY